MTKMEGGTERGERERKGRERRGETEKERAKIMTQSIKLGPKKLE